VQESARLSSENDILGKIIEKLKPGSSAESILAHDEEVRKENLFTIEELKKTILDLTDEFEEYKKQNKINTEISQECENLKQEIANIKQENEKLKNENVAISLENSKELENTKNSFNLLKSEFDALSKKYQADTENLLNKNKELYDNFEDLKGKYEFYKSKYVEEVKYSNKLQERQKTILSEVQTHVQYISILEQSAKEMQERLTKFTSDSYNNSLIRGPTNFIPPHVRNSNSALTVMEEDREKFKKVNKNLNEQISLLTKAKDEAQTNLSISRHNFLQHCMEMQECQDKLIALEKLRLSDLLHISRLEGLLSSNSIKY